MATRPTHTFDEAGRLVRTEQIDIPDELANRDALEQKLRAYLQLPTPSQQQNAKAIRALIRLVLAQLDDISDS